MNRTYRLVWNRALRIVQVASELAHSSGGGNQGAADARPLGRHHPLALACALALSIAGLSLATPVRAAQQSTGGNGGAGTGHSTPAGGVGGSAGTPVGGNGSDGGTTQPTTAGGGGGGGGAAGAAGGHGGAGSDEGGNAQGGVGGTAGTTTVTISAGGSLSSGNITSGNGGNGGNGVSGNWTGGVAGTSGGGGGGGGGIGVDIESTGTFQIVAGQTVAGGAGGKGGDSQPTNNSYFGGDGGGGAGGTALLLGIGTTLTNAGFIMGGVGGNGGVGGSVGGSGSGGSGIDGTGFTLTNTSRITGGSGGVGGSSIFPGGNGGGSGSSGGSGGSGIDGTGFTVTNTGSITGGGGGDGSGGGNGGSGIGGNGGNGGSGGSGVSGSGFILTNNTGGSINGGNGGPGGLGGSGSRASGIVGAIGEAGVGVVGTGGSTITNAGTISGGPAGDGVTRADAVDFSGGNNTLTLGNGYSFVGNVVSSSGTTNGGDTLALGGDSTTTVGTGDGSFNISDIVTTLPTSTTDTQYVGFAHFAKTGTSAWTLTGTSSGEQNWLISGGTLIGDTTSLQGTQLTDNATLDFNQTSAGTFAGVISGTGVLVKNGAGGLTLTGANSYGGGTTVNGGTLEIAATGTPGTGTLTVDNSANQNATLRVDSGASLSNQIVLNNGTTLDNAGTISKIGIGYPFAVESGNGIATVHNHSGGTINGTEVGVALFNGGSVTNEGAGSVISASAPGGGSYYFSSSGVVMMGASGTVSNTDGATIKGAATGVALLNGGTISNGVGSTIEATGTTAGDCYGIGDCAIFMGTASDYQGAGGALTLTNAGRIIGKVQMDPTAINLTTLIAGGSITGDLEIGSHAASTLTLNGANSTPQLYSTAVTGTTTFDGALIKAGSGTWVIDSNDLSSVTGTTIDAGTLQVGNGGTTGSIGTGDVLDNGTLVFDRSDAVAFGGIVSGTGMLMQHGSGTLTLTGANTYTGGTMIGAGTLQIGNGGTTGTVGTGDVLDNGTLVFDRSDAVDFTGALTGAGTLRQQGSSTLVMDGNSAAFAGSTDVSSGELMVGSVAGNGASLGGNVTVASGATLRGHGDIGGNVVNDGTLWPGGSIGTLTINGDFTQHAGGVLTIDATASGQASQLAIGGKATLGGSTVALAQAGAWAPRTDYTILTAAGGVSGQFAAASSSLLFLTPVLSYTNTAVNLSLQRNDINFASVAQTANQRATAGAANALDWHNAVYTTLTTLDAPTARHAFDQLSGEIHASARTAMVDDDRYVRDAITQHVLGTANGANGLDASTAQETTVWTSVWGHRDSHDGNGNASHLSANGSGVALGSDLPVGTASRLGAVVSSDQANTRIGTQGSSAHVLSQHAGLYASTAVNAWQLQGGAIYGWQQVSTRRYMAFGNFAGMASSRYHANTTQVYADGSYAFAMGHNTLAPFLNLAWEQLQTDAIHEVGTPASALDVAAQSSNHSYATLGLRGNFLLNESGNIRAHASVGWQHLWGDTATPTRMQFVGGGGTFDISGVPLAGNMAAVTGGVSYMVVPNVTLDASYNGQFASAARDQSARISLTWAF